MARRNQDIGARRARGGGRRGEIRAAMLAANGGVSPAQRAQLTRAMRQARASRSIQASLPQTLPRQFGPQGGPALEAGGAGRRVRRVPVDREGGGRIEQGGVAGLGHQLTRRMESGTIDEGRAKQTASDRAALSQMLGPNWRVKAYGDRGYMRRTREALASEPQNPELQALYTALMARREKLLKRARKQQEGGSGPIGGAVPAA